MKTGKVNQVTIKVNDQTVSFDWTASDYKSFVSIVERGKGGNELFYTQERFSFLANRIANAILTSGITVDKSMLTMAVAYKLEVLASNCSNGSFTSTIDIGEAIERPISQDPFIGVTAKSPYLDKEKCLVMDYMWAGENCQYLTNNRIVLYGIPDIPDHIFMAELMDDKGRAAEFEFRDSEKFYTIEEAQEEIDGYLQKQTKETMDKTKLEKFFRQLLESNGIVVVNAFNYDDEGFCVGITIKQGDVETDVIFEEASEEEDEDDDCD